MNKKYGSTESLTHVSNSEILQSRIEEQSQLIQILKQRNDQLLAKLNAAEAQNLKLIDSQTLLNKQLSDDNKRFDILEDRFNTLANNHQEMIQIKDEYKKSVADLTSQNVLLKDTLRLQDTKLLEQLSHQQSQSQVEIQNKQDFIEKLLSKINLHDNETMKLKEKLSQFQSENNDMMKKLSTDNRINSVLKTENTELKKTIEKLKCDQSELVKVNFERGESLVSCKSEIGLKDQRIRELTMDLNELKRVWTLEKEKLNTNYQLNLLKSAMDQLESELEETKFQKSVLLKELSSEKDLNRNLRKYN